MASIQDRKKTLTVEELRRRYNLDSLDKDRKAMQLVKNTINKLEIELEKFVNSISKSLKEYPDQVDKSITAWFFDGIPTNEQPQLTKQSQHLGDLYYDRETSKIYQYRLNVDNEFIWKEITDISVKDSMAIASSSSDTADNKRITFFDTPTPPYSIGDVWVNKGTYYRCRAIREDGQYNSLDWIKSSDYTDDLVLLQTKTELNQFKIDVQNDYTSNATFETSINAISGRVEETYTYINNIGVQVDGIEKNTTQDITQIKNSVENLTTATQQQINVIKDTIDNGVSKVVTTSSTFDENGLSMEKTGEQMSSKLDWDGFDVTRDKGKATETNMLSVRSDGVNAENVTVRAYLTQKPIRREKGIAMSDSTSVGLCEYWVGE